MSYQPRWFSEGLATYLETIRCDEESGKVEIGRPPVNFEYLHVILQDAPDHFFWDDLWNWQKDPPASRDDEAKRYEVSWAVVHYLADQRSQQLTQYEEALATGRDEKDAWMAIFPDLDREGLSKVIRRYLRFLQFNIAKDTLTPETVTFRDQHRLSDADVLGLRALLYSALKPVSARTPEATSALALQAINDSLREDPASYWALLVAYVRFDSLRASAEVARRAIAGHDDDWEALIWYAAVLVSEDKFDEGREALHGAIDLAPGESFPLAHASMLEAAAGHWDAATDLATRAVQVRPTSVEAMIAYASALSHVGRCREADSVAQTVTRRIPDLSEKAQRMLRESREVCPPAEQSGLPPNVLRSDN